MKSALFVPLACAALLTSLFTASAQADTDTADSPQAQIVEHQVDPTATVAAEEYWTPERMAAAQPVDRTGHMNLEGEQKPVSAEPQQEIASPLAPTNDVGLNIYRTKSVGKLFFTDVSDGEDYVCSGSVVNSPARNMAFTAGHCVHGGGEDNTWHENVVFVPGYHHNSRPHGTFEAYNLVTLQGWATNESWGYDSALILLGTNANGERLVDAVGVANGLTTGGPFEQYHVVVGYPADQEDGQVQFYCEDESKQATIFFPRQITMSCGLGGGSSGGPWLVDYDDRADGSGIGQVHGNTSNGDIFGNLRSPYYTDDVEGNMYREYANG